VVPGSKGERELKGDPQNKANQKKGKTHQGTAVLLCQQRKMCRNRRGKGETLVPGKAWGPGPLGGGGKRLGGLEFAPKKPKRGTPHPSKAQQTKGRQEEGMVREGHLRTGEEVRGG